MIKRQILIFLIRWAASSLGMWLCITLFGELSRDVNIWFYVVAGLVFSLVNSIVKPLVKTLALPLIVLTMGIFTLVVNVGMVILTMYLLGDVSMDIWGIIFSTIILTLINSLVNFLVPSYNEKHGTK